MRILQINKYHYLRGGAERVFFNTIELLRKNGHTVIPFATAYHKNVPSEYDRYFAPNPEFSELSTLKKLTAFPRFFHNKQAARNLEQLIIDQRPDIAHIHNFFNGLSLDILPVLKRHNIPVCITIHDPRLVCGAANWLNPGHKCDVCRKRAFLPCLLDRCYNDNTLISLMMMFENIHKTFLFNYDRYIDRYIFLSHAYLDAMSRENPFFRSKSEILCNFRPGCAPQPSKPGEYILYLGRLAPLKGADTLAKAARLVPDIPVHIAGTGPLLDNIKKDLPSNVTLTGFLSGNRLKEEIENSHAIVVPSECMENNPMTVIESFSLGKPAIGTNIGGIPELITHEKNGYIVPPAAPEKLAEAMKRIYCLSPAEYEQMSREAADFARANFSEDYHYQRLMEIYNSMLSQSKK